MALMAALCAGDLTLGRKLVQKGTKLTGKMSESTSYRCMVLLYGAESITKRLLYMTLENHSTKQTEYVLQVLQAKYGDDKFYSKVFCPKLPHLEFAYLWIVSILTSVQVLCHFHLLSRELPFLVEGYPGTGVRLLSVLDSLCDAQKSVRHA